MTDSTTTVRVEKIGNATLYLGDCRGILPTLPLTWSPGPENEQLLYVGDFYCGLVQACGKKFDAISDYSGCFSCGHDTREEAMAALELAVVAMGSN